MDERSAQGIVRAAVTLALTTLLIAAASGAAAAPPIAHIARACSLAGHYRSLGPTYVEKLTVSHTTCGTGMKVIKSYDACRLKAGGPKGRCTKRVNGFSCSEKRSSSGIQFIGVATCTNGRKVVKFSYTENTA